MKPLRENTAWLMFCATIVIIGHHIGMHWIAQTLFGIAALIFAIAEGIHALKPNKEKNNVE
ncbi:hypothetical protein [Actinotignum urinale]|uniref:hypothetical protein n=1 Tax=Actinotignum urinale TaxID=190146 RepID=UPI00280AE2ED|nr:hypothetical protein [Actinotignum urinale]